ncbi:hypothetical protein D3C71_1646880 [compost metagenome]
MDRYRPSHTDRYSGALISFECEHLPEATYINPFQAGNPGKIFARTRFGFENRTQFRVGIRPLSQAAKFIGLSVIGLDKNGFAHILQTIANFALQGYIRDFSMAVIILPWTISVKWISIRIGFCYGQNNGKVNFMIQYCHDNFSLLVRLGYGFLVLFLVLLLVQLMALAVVS